MGVTIDSRNAGAKTSPSATSLAWNHTVGASLTNGCLVGEGTTGASVAKRISTFQWDAAGTPVNMTNLGFKIETGNNCYAELWALVAPASGTKQVKITPTASCEITGGSSSYSLVKQATPWNASSPQTTANNTTPYQIVVTSTTNEMAIACIVENGGTAITISSGTSIFTQNIGSSNSAGAGSDDNTGSASVTMSFGGLTNGNTWAAIGGSLQYDAGGGGFTAVERRTFGSVGRVGSRRAA